MSNAMGWVKLHRKLIEWEWFNKPEMVSVYVYCLIKANHETKKWNGKTVKRGSFFTSRQTISRDTGVSVQAVRTCLDRLKSTREITIKATNAHTLISICNYDDYQSQETSSNFFANQHSNQPTTNQQPTNNQPSTTTKNDKNENNDKNDKKKNIEVCSQYFEKRILKNLFIKPTVDDIRGYCAERGNGVDAERFHDFYESKGWMVGKNKMKDWRAAVRRWEKTSFSETSQSAVNEIKNTSRAIFQPRQRMTLDEQARVATEAFFDLKVRQ